MALISSGGGKLKVTAPRGLFGRAGAGISRTAHASVKPMHFKVPKPPKVPAPKAPRAPGVAKADPNDPNVFIQGLLQSTDPAAIRALIDPVYAPVRQEIQNQIAQTAAQGKASADQMSQVYQAFEQYLGGLPGQIQAIYGGKGAQDGAALAAGMAGPQGAVGSHLAAMSNGDLMSQLGANWAAYAAAQPHIYALYATQNIKQMLNATNATEAQLRAKLLDLSSQEASSILKYLEDAQAKDTQLKEWAFQQKQSQRNAEITARNAQLKLDAQNKQIAYNNWVVAQKLGHTAEAQQWREQYQRAQLKEKYDAMSATDARAAKARDAAAARQARSIAAADRRAAAGRAAKAKAAAGKGGLTSSQAQKGINDTIKQMNAAVKAAKAPKGGGTQNIYQVDPKTGKPVLDANGKPIKIGTKKAPGTTQVNRKGLWNTIYKQYSRQLFSYYNALYPTLAKTRGAIQRLVEQRVTAVVGWGPNG